MAVMAAEAAEAVTEAPTRIQLELVVIRTVVALAVAVVPAEQVAHLAEHLRLVVTVVPVRPALLLPQAALLLVVVVVGLKTERPAQAQTVR